MKNYDIKCFKEAAEDYSFEYRTIGNWVTYSGDIYQDQSIHIDDIPRDLKRKLDIWLSGFSCFGW